MVAIVTATTTLSQAWHATTSKARNAARSRGIELRKVPRIFVDAPEAVLQPTLEHLVAHRLITGGTDLFVVQIGAYDGQTNDPIHGWIKQYGWHGVLVEPQQRPFARLQETYAGCEGILLRNAALAEASGRRTFYQVPDDVPGVPDWVGQLASFDQSTILAHRHLVPNIDDLVDAIDVDCVTFEDLLEGVDRVDLLQIDAEGYDGEIVRMFDFARWRPSIVNFESVHLTHEDYEATLRCLVSHGYRVATPGFDTIAYAS
jgi:FkbM family methyltransferase